MFICRHLPIISNSKNFKSKHLNIRYKIVIFVTYYIKTKLLDVGILITVGRGEASNTTDPTSSKRK
jgi:hypothetical protein